MAKKPDTSPRAKRFWLRMIEWYGVRMAEQFGDEPPEDWCRLIDESDNAAVKRALSIIRAQYVQHPPTLPQLDAALRPPIRVTGPSTADKLCAYVMRTRGHRLTARQIRTPWHYLGTMEGEITGVVIDADGEHPGFRVTVADMAAPDQTAFA